MQEDDFLKENGFLLSKLEEVHGQFMLLKSRLRSQKAVIEGLEYDISNYKGRVEQLTEKNRLLKEKNRALEARLNEQSILVPENFKIRNNFVKIVTDIEEKGSVETVNLRDFLDTLIEEIDFCINQLTK